MGDYGNDTNDERFSPDEGLELIRLFQNIPRRADRKAALDIIKRIAMQSPLPDGDTVLIKQPRAI